MVDPLDENLVKLIITNDEVHELQITGALADADIEYIVQEFHDSALDGLFESTFGHSRVMVFPHDLEQAQKIIAEISPNSD